MSESADTTAPRPVAALDLDGVIWRGRRAIPGSAAAVADLRSGGFQIAFVSNNSTAPAAAVVERLAGVGVQADATEILTSAQAAAAEMASLLPAGAAVLVIGEAGIIEALRDVSLVPVAPGVGKEVAGVVAGLDTEFDYHALAAAQSAIAAGAVFVATNTDPTLPVEDGVQPGSGAIIAAIEAASGTRARVAGKPHRPMADLVRARVGPAGVMVGDRPDTDGALAGELGWPFGLVLSGVTADARQADATYVASDLAALVPQLLAEPATRRRSRER